MFFNLIALVARMGVNAITTLVSTKILLGSLGGEAFGLYTLMAGVILLLSFVNGALLIATQRFLSVAIGEKNTIKQNAVFNVSLLIHMIFAVIISVLCLLIKPLLFDYVLNVPITLINEARVMFDIMILSLAFTLIGIPYSALITAHEDMVFFSISEVLIFVIRLGAAICMLLIYRDQLIIYTWLMLLAVFVGIMTKAFWSSRKYPSSRISFKAMKNPLLFKRMTSFIGWNTLGSLAVVARNQGIPIVINMFFGVLLNAAHGIAMQVNALVSSFAMAITNVFAPLIAQSKGEGNNEKMLYSAVFSNKLSFYIAGLISLPILVYTSQILSLWLGDIPEYTIDFCRLIIISFLILQLCSGINRAIYANGDIKHFQIVSSIIMLMTLPVGYVFYYFKFPPISIFYVLAFVNFMVVFTTIYFAYRLISLDLRQYFFKSFLIPVVLFVSSLLVGNFLLLLSNSLLLVIVNILFIMFLFSLSYFSFVLNSREREMICNLIVSFRV